MDWKTMRAHLDGLVREAKQRGVTQEAIALRVGLRQNAISKMLYNDNLGPQVETFVKAIEGLGVPVSAFFLQLESGRTAQLDLRQAPHPQAVSDDPATTPAALVSDQAFVREFVRALGEKLAAAYPEDSPGAAPDRRSTPSRRPNAPDGHLPRRRPPRRHPPRTKGRRPR